VAERSQYQYQQITGPVWREPVAEKLAWLPRGQQPARALPPNRLGDFARPEFAALYKPELLEWFPTDRYRGRELARALNDWSVLPQRVEAIYDPQNLEWMPRGAYPQVPIERRRLGDFARPEFEALYGAEGLQWQPSDRYAGRSLERSLTRHSVLDPSPPIVVYDPQNLEWVPRGQQPARVEPRGLLLQALLDPLPLVVAYDPQNLEWLPAGAARGPLALQGIFLGPWALDPAPVAVTEPKALIGGVTPFRRPPLRLPSWLELECRPFEEPTFWGRPVARQESLHESASVAELAESLVALRVAARFTASPHTVEARYQQLRLRARVMLIARPEENDCPERLRSIRQPSRADLLMAAMRVR